MRGLRLRPDVRGERHGSCLVTAESLKGGEA